MDAFVSESVTRAKSWNSGETGREGEVETGGSKRRRRRKSRRIEERERG
jgi:hypothetical protein